MPVARLSAANECEHVLEALVLEEGSASCPAFRHVLNACRYRNASIAADLPHLVARLHEAPGVVELVHQHALVPDAQDFIADAAAAFTVERLYIADLISAAGRPPGTPNEAATVAASRDQRRVLSLIGASERPGCGLGATIALLLDWPSIRQALDAASKPLGVPPPRCALPVAGEIKEMLALVDLASLPQRNIVFGARQLLAQHCSLWDIAEARADARRHADHPPEDDQPFAS
jgi:hypothetical protein